MLNGNASTATRDSWHAYLRQHLDGVCAVAAGALLVLAWCLPWFSIYLPLDSPPDWLPLSPAGLAPALNHLPPWWLLAIAAVVLLLGVDALLRQGRTKRDVLWLVVGGILLLLGVDGILGDMGVLAVLMGHGGPGVTLAPEPGFFILVAACGCYVAAVVLAWRRA